MNAPEKPAGAGAWRGLIVVTVATCAQYAALAWLSQFHTLDTPQQQRPILLVIAVYSSAFATYGAAWWLATRVRPGPALLGWLLGTSLLWRAILLPTPPFQEIDLYRYLWDGQVASHGRDPYRFAPAEVRDEIDRRRTGLTTPTTGPLAQRAELATLESPEYEQVLRTIHYGELPSPYPPVSQAVFAAAATTSPFADATGHLVWLKLWLTAFDFGTLLVVVWLLRMAGKPTGAAVAYGWCPLVMKEIAGSGHLDSIATLLATLAVALAVRSLPSRGPALAWVAGAAASLALGVGAKLFPIVLAPLLVWVWWRKLGFGAALTGGAVVVVGSAIALAPMMLSVAAPAATTDAEPTPEVVSLPPPPEEFITEPPDQRLPTTDRTAGLTAFLSRWEMNDLAFAVVVENLRPQQHVAAERRPWFAVTSDGFATAVIARWKSALAVVWTRADELADSEASFLLARVLTLLAFTAVAFGCAWRAGRAEAACTALPRAAFLTLAWFWLLAPTQNPWYWCWALPLLPFARCRAWAVLAACALLYYLRFWLLYHRPEPGVFGTPYDGAHFFYFVIPWLEFGPWLLLLAGESLWRRTNAVGR